MELPSMVERAGDKLVVRSLVSGAAVYQTPLSGNGNELPASRGAALIRATTSVPQHPLAGAEQLERQLEQYRLGAAGSSSKSQQLLPVAAPSSAALISQVLLEAASAEATAATGDELPQCKIRRNYSCVHCTFFTQNPRSHLSHLRDVHGERIVINECKLCLYASRHFQKLVRHMKMVHGCVDDGGSDGGLALLRGKRSVNREARKRRLEESVDPAHLAKLMQSGPTLAQLKQELQLQEMQLLQNVQTYNRQQELQQLQHIVATNDNIFSMAFQFQTHVQRQLLQRSATAAATAAPAAPLEPEPSSSDSEESPLPEEEQASPLPAPPPPTILQADEALDLSSSCNSGTQFFCNQCSYSTPIKARFKKHVKYHSMPQIKCGSCDFRSPYKWNLDRHTKNHGANGHFRCAACDFSTDIKQSLTIHELHHHVPTVSVQLASARRQRSLLVEEATTDALGSEADSPSKQQTAEPAITSAENSPSAAGSDSPLAGLPAILCSHCHQHVPNAIELLKHLQQCELALRSTSQHLQATLSDMDVDNPAASSTPLAAAEEDDIPVSVAISDRSYYGVETAPGYGEVTEQLSPEDSDALAALKKVFKCPHCTFWAATASRFHVHIVGHLNRKPFECSLCSYRSNWRWDITKHIRLKGIRDKSHLRAEVLMNDETGRRNYAKYNQYLTLMKVNSENGADMKAMRSGDIMPEMSIRQEMMPSDTSYEELQGDGSFEAAPLDAWDLRVSPKQQAQSSSAVAELNSVADPPSLPNDSGYDTTLPSLAEPTPSLSPTPSMELEQEQQQQQPLSDEPMALDLTKSSASNDEERYQAFRCGLCHQTSHWKHVIQRHSRLKHAGAMSIELLINNSYQPLDKIAKEEPSQDCAAESMQTTPSNSPKAGDNDKPMNLTTTEASECELCDFSCQSKLEMRKHRAAHRQTAHKCEQCDFACSGKLKLAKHVRQSHNNDNSNNHTNSIEQTTLSPASLEANEFELVAHCPHCPARFIQRSPEDDVFSAELALHLAAHDPEGGKEQRHNCHYCNFGADEESELQVHLVVHSVGYQAKCQSMYQNIKISLDYPAPMLTQIMLDNVQTQSRLDQQPEDAAESVWVVVKDPLDEYDDDATGGLDYMGFL